MRFVSFGNETPEDDWIKKSNALLEKLKAAADETARDKIIDDNSTHWGNLKDWLLKLSHSKCWFSEAKDVFSHWHVEHFRPKKSAKEIDGSVLDGYWWLSFDWTNFRICGSVGNTKKGTYFPLRDEGARAGLGSDLRYEVPVLLDPSDPDDPNLLSFNQEGAAIPSPFIQDDWEKYRANVSINRYKLYYDPLVQKRKILWVECRSRITKYLTELANYQKDQTNDIARYAMKEAAKGVRELINEKSEFSSVARACVQFDGDERVKKLLAT